ncbi:sigma factor regulatory protein, FecR/PupR family [Prevotella sp. DNF00663]|uniref:FecR family protein n=1 Tax=unclassified Prevotella TaxID=2638335 RepID=UPI000512F551|nr:MULTISPECIES: FecR domain-containing protein [unclassified Prevotella]KGI59742.1 hypothetical protein HMPREF0671_09960 [Prevotella sp. S7 MS 2]KXB77915.1 sigma factor regulatory protein, FecR/PupR family [Prevotella sp. DNF00663]
MVEISEHIKDLIIASLSGEMGQEEAKELQTWLRASKENKQYYYEWREIWTSTSPSPKFDVEAAYQTFLSRIKKSEPVTTHRYRYLYYAAAAIALFVVSVLSYKTGESNIKSNFADIAVEAPAGSRLKLNLPDGTKVWLNSGSKLTYSQGFGVDKREVNLMGEAYFEVKHQEDKPFSVNSTNLRVNDLGTKFNFCDYADDDEAIVTLTEGKVSLDNFMNYQNNQLLAPGQKAVLDKKTGELTINNAENDYQDWQNNMLVFNGDALNEIAKKLQRNYNIKVIVANDALYQLRFHGSFNTQEAHLRDILDALVATNKIHYRVQGKKVTFY